jgi:hypothetical protein
MAGTAAGITDKESFEAWLKARPEATRRQEAVALAHRAAMRVVPFLGWVGKLKVRRQATLLNFALWQNTLSRHAATYPSREIAAAANGDKAGKGERCDASVHDQPPSLCRPKLLRTPPSKGPVGA